MKLKDEDSEVREVEEIDPVLRVIPTIRCEFPRHVDRDVVLRCIHMYMQEKCALMSA